MDLLKPPTAVMAGNDTFLQKSIIQNKKTFHSAKTYKTKNNFFAEKTKLDHKLSKTYFIKK